MSKEKRQCPVCKNLSETTFHFCPTCRFPLKLIANKYRLTKVIAEGGFGTVYEAEHIHLEDDKKRVIKVMKSEVMDLPGMQTRFFREVRITSSLSQRNEHIVRIYDDFGEDEHLGYYYVMEYLQGHTLSELVRNNGPLDLPTFFSIFDQLCDGIGEAHKASVVHRDLKPDNIILIQKHEQDDYVKILDFGIAKPLANNSQPDLTRGVLGTPAYMSPEQCKGEKVDHATDIYATGIIMYEVLTGAPPFQESSDTSDVNAFMSVLHAHISEPPPPPTTHNPQIPLDVEKIILKTLAKNPLARYHSMSELRTALRDIASAYSQKLPPLSHPSSPSLPSISQNASSSHTRTFSGRQPLPSATPISVPDSSDVTPYSDTALASAHSDPTLPPKQKNKKQFPWLNWLLFLLLLILGGAGGAFLHFKKQKQIHFKKQTDVQKPLKRRSTPPLTQKTTTPKSPNSKSQISTTTTQNTAHPSPPAKRTNPRFPVKRPIRKILRRKKIKKKYRYQHRKTKKRYLKIIRKTHLNKNSDIPTTPPPTLKRGKTPSTSDDIFPTYAPPPQKRIKKKIDDFQRILVLGKQLKKQIKRHAPYRQIYKTAIKIQRIYKKSHKKLTRAQKTTMRDYAALAQHQFVKAFRKYFLSLAPYNFKGDKLQKKLKTMHKRYLQYLKRIHNLKRYRPSPPSLICPYFYRGEANAHFAKIYKVLAAKNSTSSRSRQYKYFYRRYKKYRNLAKREYRRGIKQRRKFSGKPCSKEVKIAMKRWKRL